MSWIERFKREPTEDLTYEVWEARPPLGKESFDQLDRVNSRVQGLIEEHGFTEEYGMKRTSRIPVIDYTTPPSG